jgi:type III secretion protein L
MFRITTCNQLPVDRKIIKASQYDAAAEAERILAEAHSCAESTRQEAGQEYERQKQQGYADGMQQAQAAAAEQMTTVVAESAVYFSAVERRVVEVVRKAFQKVIGEMDDHELLARAVRHALSWARSQSRVTLRVCPAQAIQLKSRVEEIRRGFPAIDILDVVADDRLKALDCVLETDVGAVNAGIDVQLAAIEAAMTNAIGGDIPTATTTKDMAEQATTPRQDSTAETDS